MRIYNVTERTPALMEQLLSLWEQSVRATHSFLSQPEIEKIKGYVPQALAEVTHLAIAEEAFNCPVGFLGAQNGRLEMLFLLPQSRGRGLGSALLDYGIQNFGIQELTVNEQNPQAVGFYTHMGFETYKRTDRDEAGDPYPLLYMKRSAQKKGESIHTVKILRGQRDSNSFYVPSNYGPLLLDTGAATTQLQKSALTAGLAPVGTKEGHGIVGSKDQEMAIVEELQIGDIRENQLPVTLDDTEGILGCDVLKNHPFTLDTQADMLTWIPPFTDGLRGNLGQRNYLYVNIQIGGEDCLALVDTGASCSILDEAFFAQVFGEAEETRAEEGTDWTGAAFDTRVLPLEGVVIGGVPLPKHEFALLDFGNVFPFMEYPIAAILGASTFACGKFSFNLKDGYLKLEK